MNASLRTEDISVQGHSSIDAIEALEKNTQQAIQQKRANTRVAGSFPSLVEPANVSDRIIEPAQAICKDISRSGCRLVASKPLHVGDVYRIVIKDRNLDIPEMFCRCVRCSLLSETAFECGMSFFNSIKLPGASVESPEDLI
jgi:hypothetical protein